MSVSQEAASPQVRINASPTKTEQLEEHKDSDNQMLNIVGPNRLPSPTPYSWMPKYTSLSNTKMFEILMHFPLQHLNIKDPNTIPL